MKRSPHSAAAVLGLVFALVLPAAAQRGRAARMKDEPDIPLQTTREAKDVDAQTHAFNTALEPALAAAAKSTVRIWAGESKLAYGTVFGDGTTILTKWSQIANRRSRLIVDAGDGNGRAVVIDRVYEDEDLAVLRLARGEPLPAVKWSDATPSRGSFLAAAQPDGHIAGFGVLSVPARNLRETDQAFLGITGDIAYTGKGIRIEQVEKGSGAAKAGMKKGDVILKVGDRTTSGVMELRSAMTGLVPGSTVKILLMTPAGEKTVNVVLGNRTEYPGIPQARLNAMEQMGGPTSKVRDGFPHAAQTDMRLAPDQMGGPIVDLKGEVVGVLLARADRTRSFFMPAADIQAMLSQPGKGPDLAKVRTAETPQEMAQLMDQARPQRQGGAGQARPRISRQRLKKHFEDMEALMDYMNEEMRSLEAGR